MRLTLQSESIMLKPAAWPSLPRAIRAVDVNSPVGAAQLLHSTALVQVESVSAPHNRITAETCHVDRETQQIAQRQQRQVSRHVSISCTLQRNYGGASHP